MPPSIIFPVPGSRGICPLRKTKPEARTAWEYGPMAAGAVLVAMACMARILSQLLAAGEGSAHRDRVGVFEVAPVRNAARDTRQPEAARGELPLEQERSR